MPAPSAWSCQVNPFQTTRPARMIFAGEAGRLRAKVIRGRLTREITAGLKSLNNPNLRSRLGQTFKVSTPHRYHALDNLGPNRKIVVLTGERYPEFSLRFDQPVPQSLLWALRAAFTRPGAKPPAKEISDEPQGQHQGQLVRPADAQEKRQPRKRVWGGEATEDERRYCVQRRQKVNRRKMSALQKKRWKDPAQREAQAERMRTLNAAKAKAKETSDADAPNPGL